MTKERRFFSSLDRYLKRSIAASVSSCWLPTFHILGMIVAAGVAFIFAIRTFPAQHSKLPMVAVLPATTENNQQMNASSPASESQSVSYRHTVTAEVQKGDTLINVLQRNEISPAEIHELIAATRPVHNLGRLQQGQLLLLDYDERDGRIYHFETESGENKIVVEREGEALKARKEALEFVIKDRVVSGRIEDSLFVAADEAGLPAPVILELANIFACDIDFDSDIRTNDAFLVLLQEKYLNGKLVQDNRVLAAGMVAGGKPYWAFHFKGENGRGGYYDENGRALRKAFLKSPLKFSRVSSGFSRRRLHPILKTYRPHLGVDYAAPTGTPIHSVADGRILFVGWNGGYGNYIKIRHNNTYTSTYGHLRRFAKGIRRGKHVQQGDVIGYVGATGLATGPHLDFRLMKNDQFINPLKVNFADADPLPRKDVAAFRAQMDHYLSEIRNQQNAPSEPSFQMTSYQLSR